MKINPKIKLNLCVIFGVHVRISLSQFIIWWSY